MSYRNGGLIIAKKVIDGNTAIREIGMVVGIDPVTGHVKGAVAPRYAVLVTKIVEETCVADLQVTGIAKVRIKDGDNFSAGAAIGSDPATGYGETVADDTVATFIGYAMDPHNPVDPQGYVAVLLGK